MKEVILNSLMREHLLKGFIGKDPRFIELVKKLKRVAETDIHILLIGETGSGKNLCAEFIHHFSTRRNAPYIVFNCGACPETIFESQIFGHKKGAFTGACEDRIGLFEEAHTGTLVLDEINSLNFASQVKLNYFLETGHFRRIGENRLRQAEVRIISASNVNLRNEVQAGRFREDLYYRLAEYEIYIPPLRSRKGDIVLLVDHFLKKYAHLNTISPISFTKKALDDIQKYDWPGNVRELENFIKHCIIDAKTNVIDFVPVQDNNKSPSWSQDTATDDLPWRVAKNQAITLFKIEYLKNLLTRYHGVVAHCAQHANIQPPDFWKLMRKYNIKVENFRSSN